MASLLRFVLDKNNIMIGWLEVVGVGGMRRRGLVMVPILCQLCLSMLAESPLGLILTSLPLGINTLTLTTLTMIIQGLQQA